MANTWGALSWNSGNWGDQNNVTLSVTGFGNSISLNSVDSYPNQGWGSDFWGSENWGESGITLSVTGLSLEIDLGARETWGQLAWNASDTEWGGPFVPQVAIGQQINISGQQLNISQGEESITSATEIFLSENPLQGLTIAEGTIDPAPDALVTGQQLNFNVGSVTAFNEQGWGRDDWGTEVWGAQGIWTSVSLTGFDLSVTSGIQETWGQDEWGATTTEWGGNSVTDVDILSIASPTGIELTAAEGTVDPSPDATVIGIGLTMGLGLGSVSGNADVIETGEQVNITLGTATLEAVTFANVTGQQLNFSVGTAVAGASAEIFPTGNGLTVSVNNINVQSWQIVDTGSNVTWNEVDTAA